MISQKLFLHNSRFLSTVRKMTAKVIIASNNYEGLPKENDFVMIEENIPTLKDGEFLAKSEYLSAERRPYPSKANVGKVVSAEQIARIIDSKNPKFKTNDLLIADFGWRTRTISNGVDKGFDISPPRQLPNLENLPASLALGVCGIPGCIAYCALFDVGDIKEGQVVVISAVGDCIGSTASQIAKIKGCKVIGLTSSEEKINWLINELGIDVALNYNATNFEEKFNAATPNGVDCYIDNVGGEISSIVMTRINKFGKVAVCGSLSTYNSPDNTAKAAEIQTTIKVAHLKMKGVSTISALKRWDEATGQILNWVKEGKIKYQQNVIKGFENTTKIHIKALQEENLGKTIIEAN